MIEARLFSDQGAALAALQGLKGKADRGDLVDLVDLVESGIAVRLVDGAGVQVGACVLQAEGRELWVTAAIGQARFPLCPALDQFATGMAGKRFDAVCFRTERPGLVKRMARIGYEITGHEGRATFMRKRITC